MRLSPPFRSLLHFCWLLIASSAFAEPGSIDPAFSGRVLDSNLTPQGITALAVQPDSRIVIGGYTTLSGQTSQQALIRLNSDGSRDTSFSADPRLRVLAVAVLPDGKILAGGAWPYNGSTESTLFRLMPNGERDTSFQAKVVGGAVYHLMVLPDGKMVIGGAFQNVSNIARPYLARLNEDGTLDESFSPALNATVYTAGLQADGKIVAGGLFTHTVNDQPRNCLARFNTDGSLDTGFNAHANGASSNSVTTLAIRPDGRIIVSGIFSRINSVSRSYSAVLNADGSPALDETLRIVLDNGSYSNSANARSLALQSDGGMIVSGRFTHINQHPYGNVGLFRGTPETYFVSETPVYTTIMGTMLQNDGRILTTTAQIPEQGAAQTLVRRLDNAPAIQSLTANGGTQVLWLRGGSAPDPVYTTFELSNDDGASWTLLGRGTRVAGGWALDGLSLPVSGDIRARGRIVGGGFNGSSGLVEQVMHLGANGPQLTVKNPSGELLPSATGSYAFGADRRIAKTFTLKNTGNGALTLEGIRTPAYTFKLDTSNLPGSLLPGQQGTFTVYFDPPSEDAAQQTVQIFSNDPAASPYQLLLTGTGALNANANLNALEATPIAYNYSALFTTVPFDPDRLTYTMFVPNNISQVRIYAWPAYRPSPFTHSTVRIDGEEIQDPGYQGKLVAFTAFSQKVMVEVTAMDGVTQKTYEVTLIRGTPKTGDLDFSFAINDSVISNHYGSAVTVAPDGSILLTAAPSEGNEDQVMKWDATGTPDTAFVSQARSGTGIQQLDDGSILVFGQVGGEGISGKPPIVLLDSTGNRIPAFTPPAIQFSQVRCAARQPDGKIILGGNDFRAGPVTFGPLIRLMPNGDLDLSFKPVLTGTVQALNLDRAGRILAGVSFSSPSGYSQLVRLNPDGSLYLGNPLEDPQSQHSFAGPVTVIENAADDKWLIVANSQVIRLNADWTRDTTFYTIFPATSLAIQADGKIIVGYEGEMVPLSRYKDNGVFDTTFTPKLYRAFGLALQADGKLIVNGPMTPNRTEGASLWKHVLRLHNDPATQQLTIVDSNKIRWLRGGSSPEARRVYFEVSTDEGQTWNYLKDGYRISGGWEAAHVGLPQAGRVRARAIIGSGLYNRSSGIVESLSPTFTFAAPAIALHMNEQPLIHGDEIDFTRAGAKSGIQRRIISISNHGDSNLHGISADLEGADAAQFRFISQPSTTLEPGETASVEVEFKPQTEGIKSAQLKFVSNDPAAPTITLDLIGTGEKAILPGTTTLPTRSIGAQTVTLAGTVMPKGAAQTVTFEYGLSTALGQTAGADPLHVEAEAHTAEVTAEITGLLPHTRYYYRVASISSQGASTGKTLFFTTLNRAPAGTADSKAVSQGSIAVLNPLNNDADPDGDTLGLHSLTSLDPKNAGTLRKAGNQVVFTAASTFTGATFSYKTKDAFGGISDPIQVTLTSALVSLYSNIDQRAAGGSYELTVQTEAAWSVQSKPSWASLDASSGDGNQSLVLVLSPNHGKQLRSANLVIGGTTHVLSQAGVEAPSLLAPASIPAARVGVPFLLDIPTTGLPVTYSVKNMPPGLKIDSSGRIQGQPAKAGHYLISIQAKNAAGNAPLPVEFSLTVAEYPASLSGRFEGFLVPDETTNANTGGRFEVTVTTSGAYSGKLILGPQTLALKGAVTLDDSTSPQSAFATPVISSKTTSATRAGILITSTGASLALLPEGQFPANVGNGWKIPWNGKDLQADAYAGLHTFVLQNPDSSSGLPAGHSFGSFTSVSKTGAVKLAGRLADGSIFTTGTFIGEIQQGETKQGKVLIYQSLYKNKGALAGVLQVNPVDHTVSGHTYWVKSASDPKTKDRIYPTGFPVASLDAAGSLMPVTTAGRVVMNLPNNTDGNATLLFKDGGLSGENQLPVTLSNASPKSFAQKAVVLPGTAVAATLLKVDAVTGLFSGDLTVPGPTKALDRKTPYIGQIVRIGTDIRGYGFFLLPQLPTGLEALKTTLQLSGQVTLNPAAAD